MSGKVVLVVDDEFEVVEMLEAILADRGYRIVTAFHGKQALARLAETKVDLVLTDYMMPVMSGPRLVQAMVSKPELKNIPVVLMTALDEDTAARSGISYKAFLRKPFKVQHVVEIIGALLGDSASHA